MSRDFNVSIRPPPGAFRLSQDATAGAVPFAATEQDPGPTDRGSDRSGSPKAHHQLRRPCRVMPSSPGRRRAGRGRRAPASAPSPRAPTGVGRRSATVWRNAARKAFGSCGDYHSLCVHHRKQAAHQSASATSGKPWKPTLPGLSWGLSRFRCAAPACDRILAVWSQAESHPARTSPLPKPPLSLGQPPSQPRRRKWPFRRNAHGVGGDRNAHLRSFQGNSPSQRLSKPPSTRKSLTGTPVQISPPCPHMAWASLSARAAKLPL